MKGVTRSYQKSATEVSIADNLFAHGHGCHFPLKCIAMVGAAASDDWVVSAIRKGAYVLTMILSESIQHIRLIQPTHTRVSAPIGGRSGKAKRLWADLSEGGCVCVYTELLMVKMSL